METSDQGVIRALRRLTIAVWALVGVVGLFAAMYLSAHIPWVRSSADTFETSRPSSSSMARSQAEYGRFYDLPVEKQIEAASVIAILRYQRDGDRLKCQISEILKRVPNTTFDFKVGDEYPSCSRYVKPDTEYGDGQIMFFVGSPAEMRYSVTFFGDRVTGLGDMPLEMLRAKAKEASK